MSRFSKRSKAQRKIKKTSLVFCEPSNFDPDEDYTVLDVDSKMMELINQPAHEYPAPELIEEDGEAYVFGPLYDLDEYYHDGYVEMKNGEIGFMNEKITMKKYNNKYGCPYLNEYSPLLANNPEYIQSVQQNYPEIIWLGSMTTRKGVCHLHYHVDKIKIVLIVLLLIEIIFM